MDLTQRDAFDQGTLGPGNVEDIGRGRWMARRLQEDRVSEVKDFVQGIAVGQREIEKDAAQREGRKQKQDGSAGPRPNGWWGVSPARARSRLHAQSRN